MFKEQIHILLQNLLSFILFKSDSRQELVHTLQHSFGLQ